MKKTTTPAKIPAKAPTKTPTKTPTKPTQEYKLGGMSECAVPARVRVSPKQPTASAPAAAPPKAAVKVPTSSRSAAAPRRMGGLDAAAKVLAESGKPMRCGELMEKIEARGLWKTKGKTPAATINAAMIREIKSKGRESRFKKVGRGMFAAAQRSKL